MFDIEKSHRIFHEIASHIAFFAPLNLRVKFRNDINLKLNNRKSQINTKNRNTRQKNNISSIRWKAMFLLHFDTKNHVFERMPNVKRITCNIETLVRLRQMPT